MAEGKLSADLRISKRFKYTPIFKTSFITGKEKPRKRCCSCCHHKAVRIVGYVFLVLLLIASVACTVVLWSTNLYNNSFTEYMALRNYSQTLEWWKKPPVTPKVQVFIFNYTNVPEFLSSGEKLKVKELGPYTYLETIEKVNLKWNNDSITFQERRSYKFAPELSRGWESDRVVVPNVPLIAAAWTVRNEYYLVRMSLASMLRSLDAHPFVSVGVQELLWGYDDPVFSVARPVIAVKHKMNARKFGLLAPKAGVSPWRMTVDTGEMDVARAGVVTHYNGEDRVDYWRTEECNRIDGVEGGTFPPPAIHPESRLHIYNRDVCRRFPLVFKEHSQGFHGIPTLRFHPPRDVFAHASDNPANACYCDPVLSVCPPAGVFNVSPCAFDAPIFVSFPHFYLGDPVLQETVEGLNPDPRKHDMYVDLHPVLGVPLSGKSAFQVNIMVGKVNPIHQLNSFHDRSILPIAWFNVVLDEMPSELRFLLYHATFSARAVHLALLYGSPVVALACACALLRAAVRARRGPREPPMLPLPAAAVSALGTADAFHAP